MPWMRGIEIVVSRKDDPETKSVFKAHKIDFTIRSTVGWPADTADITLYNLGVDEVKFLQDKSYGDMYIEIRAGYFEDERGANAGHSKYQSPEQADSEVRIEIGPKLPTIFSGIVTNAVGFRRPPEHVTQLFCISKAYGASTEFTQMNDIPNGATLEDAIRSMCADYGFSTISSFGVDESVFKSVLKLGRVFHDTFLEEFRTLLGEYNLLFSVTTGEIQIFPDTYGNKDAVDRMSKDREPIKLDANQVIGNPIAGIATYSLNTFLNASYQPGMILDVSPLLGEQLLANGVTSVTGKGVVLNTDQSVFRWAMEDKYFITEVVHHGSTHETVFQTTITAMLGGNTAMGGKEAAWQQMYLNSGMAMESF